MFSPSTKPGGRKRPARIPSALSNRALRCYMSETAPGLEPGRRRLTMASRLLRRQVMTLTDAAAARVRELTEAAGKPIAGLRVGVRNGGCAGMSYTMELAEAVSPLDEVVEDKGVKLLIDPKAVLFLLGAEMDFKVDRLSATFSFRNPNETSACGCGESVAITPVSPDGLNELFEPFGAVQVKRMFGGAGVYGEGLCFTIEAEGEVFLKVDGETEG